MVTRSRTSPAAPDQAAPRDATRSRDLIVEAAIDFLEHHPYRELNAGVLMERTGLSRPAFYQYFKNIPALIAHLLERLAAEMGEAANEWLTEDGDRIEALRVGHEGIATVVRRHGRLFRAISEAAHLDADLEMVWNMFVDEWVAGVADRIRHEQAQGLIDRTLDAEWVSRALNLMDVAILIGAFGKDPQDPLDAVVETIMTVWCRTLYGPDGPPAARGG